MVRRDLAAALLMGPRANLPQAHAARVRGRSVIGATASTRGGRLSVVRVPPVTPGSAAIG